MSIKFVHAAADDLYSFICSLSSPLSGSCWSSITIGGNAKSVQQTIEMKLLPWWHTQHYLFFFCAKFFFSASHHFFGADLTTSFLSSFLLSPSFKCRWCYSVSFFYYYHLFTLLLIVKLIICRAVCWLFVRDSILLLFIFFVLFYLIVTITIDD